MRPANAAHDFDDVDSAANARAFVLYLDAVGQQSPVRAYKERTFALLGVGEGQRLLDVGCGTGDDVRLLAERVGRSGSVSGADKSETMVAEARERSVGSGLPVEYVCCDVTQLRFPDDTFDGCRADRVLMHLDEPVKAVAEMFRVARPGGRVVVAEPDWETLVVDGVERRLARKILNFHCDNLRQGWIGRQLLSLFKGAGLKEIGLDSTALMLNEYALAEKILGIKSAAVRAFEAGVISDDELIGWLASLKRANQQGRFFCAITGFAAVGLKP